MAVIEIKAATLPGFPYYFPYRTGVRLRNNVSALGGKVFTGDASVSITAAASVTSLRDARVNASVGLNAFSTSLSNGTYPTSASTDLTASASVVLDRNAAVAADLTVTSTLAAEAIRDQALDSTLEIAAGIDYPAMHLDALADAATLITTSPTVAPLLDGVFHASLGVAGNFTPEGQLDAVANTEISVTAATLAITIREQIIEAATEIVANISQDFQLDALGSADTVISAGITNALLRTLYAESDLNSVVIFSTKTINADVKTIVSGELSAEALRTQYASATLAVTANTLVDSLDTRFAETTLVETATAAALSQIQGRFSFTLDLTADSAATARRTQYAAATQPVSAIGVANINHAQRLSTTLPVSATIAADSHVSRFATASTVISANTVPAVSRFTFAEAFFTEITADNPAVMLRKVYMTADSIINAVADPLMQLDGMFDTDLTIEATIDSFIRGSVVGDADLGVNFFCFPENIAHFLSFAILRLTADIQAKGGLYFIADVNLDAQAVLAESTIDRTVWAQADIVQVTAEIEKIAVEFNQVMEAELALVVENPAIMLWRHAGGNAMWLSFFYAGYGRRYPVATLASTEE